MVKKMTKAVKIENFSYCYPDGTKALDNINLDIACNRKTVLIGPNGAGKSTLLLAINGFLNGTGKVSIDGIEINKKNSKKIRSLVGCCLENPDDQLFMPTLFEDVAFGLLNMGLATKEVRERVENALNSVGLANMSDRAPHHLSAGQKRAAAIATVISMSPGIITFDEPDGNLDPRNRKILTKILVGLSQTLVIATCNMSFAAAIADRAVLIDSGRVIAEGSAREIMSDAGLMETHGLEVPEFKDCLKTV